MCQYGTPCTDTSLGMKFPRFQLKQLACKMQNVKNCDSLAACPYCSRIHTACGKMSKSNPEKTRQNASSLVAPANAPSLAERKKPCTGGQNTAGGERSVTPGKGEIERKSPSRGRGQGGWDQFIIHHSSFIIHHWLAPASSVTLTKRPSFIQKPD